MSRQEMQTRRTDRGTISQAAGRALLTNDSPFAIKEAYVKLRNGLLFCMTKDGKRQCKTFAVTSANPGDGKSVTSANIAISFAMLGKKTLLIDCDMRKPMQRKMFGIESKHGICDFLANIGDCEVFTEKSLPLSVICTGTLPPNPSELLLSENMKHFIEYLSEQYEYIIIDTPPINTVADAQIVSTLVDGMVVVTKSGKTSSDELKYAINAIDQAGGNMCGTVLNCVNLKSLKSSYRYKYSKYGYKYSYKYSYGKNSK